MSKELIDIDPATKAEEKINQQLRDAGYDPEQVARVGVKATLLAASESPMNPKNREIAGLKAHVAELTETMLTQNNAITSLYGTIKELSNHGKWISTSEQGLPHNKWVLGWWPLAEIPYAVVMDYESESGICLMEGGKELGLPDYWMELPEPPEQPIVKSVKWAEGIEDWKVKIYKPEGKHDGD